MSWGIFFEWIKSALLRKRSAILLSPATNLLSVRFHIVDKYLHSLIISTSFQISRGFLLPDWNLEWFAALFEMFPRTCDVRHVGILFRFDINSASFRKKCFVFFSFVVRCRLVIHFYSLFFGLLVRFFPQHQDFQQKRLYSSRQAFLISSCNPILFYSGENIACCTWNTFAVLQTSLR